MTDNILVSLIVLWFSQCLFLNNPWAGIYITAETMQNIMSSDEVIGPNKTSSKLTSRDTSGGNWLNESAIENVNGSDNDCNDEKGKEVGKGSCNNLDVAVTYDDSETTTSGIPEVISASPEVDETSVDDLTGFVTDVVKDTATTLRGNNITDIPAAITNSTVAMTTATSFVNVTTTEMSIDVTYTPGLEYCDCDVTKNECNINCCCDKDCVLRDKMLFITCLPVQSARSIVFPDDYSNRYCYSTRFVYNNDKTVSRVVEKSSDGLFCIAVDNLPAGILYENIFPIKSVDEFNRKMRRRRKYVVGWSQHDTSDGKHKNTHLATNVARFLFNFTRYKYADYIWTFTNYTQVYLNPLFVATPRTSLTYCGSRSSLSSAGRNCDRARPILYLVDASYSCLRKIPKNKNDCEKFYQHHDIYSYYNKNLRVLAIPQTMFNSTSLSEECSDESCIGIIASICEDDNMLVCYDDGAITKPVYNQLLAVCSNVVDRVSYVVRHNETYGITQINVLFHLVNLSSSHKSEYFRQYFEIKHVRTMAYNTSNSARVATSMPFLKSGMPGYLPGRPIISGKKAAGIQTQSENGNDLAFQYVILNNDNRYWLGLPKLGSLMDGHCDNNYNHHRNILFLENTKSECLLQLGVPLNCDSTRNKTVQVLLGNYYSINVTDARRANIYISSYGDPDPSDPDVWVPVLIRTAKTEFTKKRFDSSVSCAGVFTDSHLKILYSYTGSVGRPQAKIVGALMSLRFNDESVVRIGSDFEILRITSTVLFVDVSKPDDAQVKFADPPVYEIKLPQDFFYPFLSSSVNIKPYCFLYHFVIIIILFC